MCICIWTYKTRNYVKQEDWSMKVSIVEFKLLGNLMSATK